MKKYLLIILMLFVNIGNISYSQVIQSENNVLQSQNQKEKTITKSVNDLRTFQELSEIGLTKPKSDKDWVIMTTILICDSLNILPHVILAIMAVETGEKYSVLYNYHHYGNTPHYKSGGVFQLMNEHTMRWSGDTANACSGLDRNCLYETIPKLWIRIEYSKQLIEKKNGVWKDHFYYSWIHNGGHLSAGLSNPVVKKFVRMLKYWETQVEVVRVNILYEKNIRDFKEFQKQMNTQYLDTVIVADNTRVKIINKYHNETNIWQNVHNTIIDTNYVSDIRKWNLPNDFQFDIGLRNDYNMKETQKTYTIKFYL